MKGIHHPEIWTFWDSCRMVFFVFSEDGASLLLLAPQFGEFQMFISVFECPFFIENPINSLSLVISMWCGTPGTLVNTKLVIHGYSWIIFLAGCSSTLRCGFWSCWPIKKKTCVKMPKKKSSNDNQNPGKKRLNLLWLCTTISKMVIYRGFSHSKWWFSRN